MKRAMSLGVLLVLVLAFVGTAMAEWSKEPVATYQLEDSQHRAVNFFVYRTNDVDGDKVLLPNNQYLDIKDGIYPAWVVDMVQDGKNIFMVTASKYSSQVWHYNGIDFYPFLRGLVSVQAAPVTKVNMPPLVRIYCLTRLDSEKVFSGLLILQGGEWKIFPYQKQGDWMYTAEKLDLFGSELRITHVRIDKDSAPEKTYFNLSTPYRGFYIYSPRMDPYKSE